MLFSARFIADGGLPESGTVRSCIGAHRTGRPRAISCVPEPAVAGRSSSRAMSARPLERGSLGYAKPFYVRSSPVMQSHLWRHLTRVGAALALAPAIALAQQPTTITGRVTTEAGTPLQGASVTIPALSLGTYSNQDGRYTFTVPATRSTGQLVRVTARRIGYQAQAVNLTLSGGTLTQDFTLVAT